jgi:hypothetical protein
VKLIVSHNKQKINIKSQRATSRMKNFFGSLIFATEKTPPISKEQHLRYIKSKNGGIRACARAKIAHWFSNVVKEPYSCLWAHPGRPPPTHPARTLSLLRGVSELQHLQRPEKYSKDYSRVRKKYPPVMVIGRKNKVKDRGGAFVCFSCLQVHKEEKGGGLFCFLMEGCTLHIAHCTT